MRKLYRYSKYCVWCALYIGVIAPTSLIDPRTDFALVMAALCTLAIAELPSIVRLFTGGEGP